jgi:hypothetical protein
MNGQMRRGTKQQPAVRFYDDYYDL